MKILILRCLSLVLAILAIGVVLHAAEPATASTRAADIVAGHADEGGFNVVGEIFSWGMSPLWVCSIILFAFVIERFRSLKPDNVIDPALIERVCALAVEGKIDVAQQECAANSTVLGKAWAQGLTEFRLGGTSLVEALTTATVLHLKPLKRNLAGIATIGVICPLFGLLGTIIGMIITFTHISIAGGANKSAIAGGIAFALVKTAGGLVVAIPAIVMGRYFQARLTALADLAEAGINRVNHRYIHGKAAPVETTRAPSVSRAADHLVAATVRA